MSHWISFPRREGVTSRQAHADIPDGTYEREIGKEGFFGPATHMYHPHPPTGWTDWQGEDRPRAFDTTKLPGATPSPWDAGLLLSNAHVAIRFWGTDKAMGQLARNADGDELIFVHAGEGALFCDYGHFDYSEGDYIVLPRGTSWRIEPTSPTRALLVEATGDSYRLPDKGIIGDHAVFDAAALYVPELDDAFRAQQGEDQWQVVVKRRGRLSTVTYPFNPLDAVGWKGDLMPVKLNWRDLRPVMSHRFHIPPSAHCLFITERFVFCTFCPRPLESDPGSLKLPFYHNNDDFDEFIFYHRGQYVGRDNIGPGMITLHPGGFPHGPHPKAYEAAKNATRTETDEVAVMIDTRDPLDLGPAAEASEWDGYVASWGGANRKEAAE